MKRIFLGVSALILGAATWGAAQSLEDLNIQIHGFATQSLLYTNQNNVFTTNSTQGSPAWTEAVANVTANPVSKLRIGVQIRYFLLGNYGNNIIVDWASGDYKYNEYFGLRMGKVKTPSSMFNETQDIDPAFVWSLLPQGVYAIGNRTTTLAHYGLTVYGTTGEGMKAIGKWDYKIYGGERVVPQGDGILLPATEAGYTYPSGAAGALMGAQLRWHTPIKGLMLGAHDGLSDQHANITYTGTKAYKACAADCQALYIVPKFETQYIFGQYEYKKLLVAGEFYHIDTTRKTQFANGGPLVVDRTSQRHAWYGMVTYKVTDKLTAGFYEVDSVATHILTKGPLRDNRDYTVAGRYDFNPYLYAKFEQHFIYGEAVDFDSATNPQGLKPTTDLTIVKLGVSF